MPKNLPTRCKSCGVRKRDGFNVSRRGLCDTCGIERMEAALIAMGVSVQRAIRQVERKRRAEIQGLPPEGVGGSSPAT